MTDTLRVNVSYRPLRIGWAVREGDFEAIRKAIRYSHALWGGRFNPILIVDREDEARQLIELFRLDFIWPIGDSPELQAFVEKFPHLASPILTGDIFWKDSDNNPHSNALDIRNALIYMEGRPEWRTLFSEDMRAFEWEASDPLADVFLMHFGAFPDKDEIGIDYREIAHEFMRTEVYKLDPGTPIPADLTEHSTLATISRMGLKRDHVVKPGWDMPGFFYGRAANANDLVGYWNIRASDIPLFFVDADHLDRYVDIVPAWQNAMLEHVKLRRAEWQRRLGVWYHPEDELPDLIADKTLMRCQIREHFWKGGGICPPVMYLGKASALGIVGEIQGTPRVDFAFTDKPFKSDVFFHTQLLVATVSLYNNLHRNEQFTFTVPYAPELNNELERQMHVQFRHLRVAPEGIGLIIDATSHDDSISAISVTALTKLILSTAKIESTPNQAGRIARQLINQLGGVQGARIFKIPGVRRLIKSYGLRDSFNCKMALDAIADKSSGNGRGTFGAHADLHIEQRERGTKLTPRDVFTYMVDKGLFRMGIDLTCSNCQMVSWVPLDVVEERVTCELCGHHYNATRQLVGSGWSYRRTGVLGTERHAQGAIPVVLTLQQLHTAFHGSRHDDMYSASLDLTLQSTPELLKCETDFLWISLGRYPDKASLIFSECKDEGAIDFESFKHDLENLRRVCDAFPGTRFQTYMMYVKLSPFTDEEIDFAKGMNQERRHRVILLTAEELDPYFAHENLRNKHKVSTYMSSPDDMANATAVRYFQEE